MPKIKKPKPTKPYNKLYRLWLAILVLAALLPSLVFAAAIECKTIASGVFTSTQNTAFVGVPRYAKNVFYVVDSTVVSGTAPSMTVQFVHSYDGTAMTVGGNTAVTTAISTVSKQVVLWKDSVSGIPSPVLGYHRAQLTISGTTPSFTASFQMCYEDR